MLSTVNPVIFTVGLFPVPPVNVFIPLDTLVISLPSAVVRNISERSVEPEYIVPPLNVVAETELKEISSSRLTIGLFAVPPVDMFIPPDTLVISFSSVEPVTTLPSMSIPKLLTDVPDAKLFMLK